MYGPGPIPPPRPDLAARVGIVLMRVILTAVPLVTIGMLGWVPLAWLAIVRRRKQDWIMLVLTAALCTASLVACDSTASDDNVQAFTGACGLILMSVFCSAYYLVTDLRRLYVRRPRQPWADPAALGAAAPPPPYATAPAPLARAGYPAPWAEPRQVPRPGPDPFQPLAPPAANPPPAAAPASGERLERVRAELDELSAYLREHGQRLEER